MGADLVIINAKVITVDHEFSIRQAVAIKDDKITFVGSNEDVKPHITPETKVLDLQGKPVLPGINETHIHPAFFGAARPPLILDLADPGIQSIQDLVEVLRQKVSEAEPGEWIRGYGWDQGALKECMNDPSRLPRKYDLDPVSADNPVAFIDFSAHTFLVNSKALEIAGVSKDSPDLKGGEMERDPETGEPTGIFKESQESIDEHVPPLNRDEKKQAMLTALQHFAANGITSVTDGAIGPGGETYVFGVLSSEFANIYRELLQEGKLTARVNVLLLLSDYGSFTLEDTKKTFETFDFPEVDEKTWLNFPGIKLFADGIPLTYTSWMNEDYVSGDAGHGTSVVSGETEQEQRDNLMEMIEYIHSKGYQIGVHATGDRAIDATVDGFVRAIDKMPEKDLRHYVIHGDFVSAERAERLAKYGCGISMQPSIAAKISDFEPAVVGDERAAYEWPMRTALNVGANLTSSSDAPVTYPNWRQGVQDAVLREGWVSGNVNGPEECITVEEAIRTYTINGAWQDHMEDIKGSIEVGKLADLCVIDRDILEIDPHEIGKISVLMTIVGGKIIFDEIG